MDVSTDFTDTERLALGGFPAGYSGKTRYANSLDLRQYATWCTSHGLRPITRATDPYLTEERYWGSRAIWVPAGISRVVT